MISCRQMLKPLYVLLKYWISFVTRDDQVRGMIDVVKREVRE